MQTVDELRQKINKAGWRLRELPVRTGGLGSTDILYWKIIAVKGERDIILGDKTLDSALLKMANTLGI